MLCRNDASFAVSFNDPSQLKVATGMGGHVIVNSPSVQSKQELDVLTTLGLIKDAGSAIPPSNDVVPAITGTFEVGETLEVTTGEWLGNPSDFVITYQWTSDTNDIVGSTTSTYKVVSGDLGSVIGCVVTATTVAGSASETATGSDEIK